MGQYRVMGITNIADGNESNRKQKLVVILNHFHGVTMKHWKKYEKPWIVKEKKMTFPMKKNGMRLGMMGLGMMGLGMMGMTR